MVEKSDAPERGAAGAETSGAPGCAALDAKDEVTVASEREDDPGNTDCAARRSLLDSSSLSRSSVSSPRFLINVMMLSAE